MPISPELQAKIDALADENLKANILRRLNRTWKRTMTDEKIFEGMVENYNQVMAQRVLREARLHKWCDDEVLAFIQYFLKQQPQWYAEYVQQERDGGQIDADLAWNIRKLGEQWRPDLSWEDCDELFGKVRDYADAKLMVTPRSKS